MTSTLQLSGVRPVQTRQLMLGVRTSAAPARPILVGGAKGAALGLKGLDNICQADMVKSLPGIVIAKRGPNTLRNHCIRGWINQGVPLDEGCAAAACGTPAS